MAIISEVNAVCDLMIKATNLVRNIGDGYYKGSAEIDVFQSKVFMLGEKQAQWEEQVRTYGMSENKHLMNLVMLAGEILEKQEQLVERLKKKRGLRWKKIVFPSQLVVILNHVIEVVDAGPLLLQVRAANRDLLLLTLRDTPAELPFGPEPKYVPLTNYVEQVQSALENAVGPSVVTLFGIAGIGKSSLAKYVGLRYQDQKRSKNQTTRFCFPDGVFYLFCGKEADDSKIRHLQTELIKKLGFGSSLTAPRLSEFVGSDMRADSERKEGLEDVSHILRFHLTKQQLLIILDDVWDPELILGLVTPAEGVKYLVTSQIREIWSDAIRIELQSPDLEVARRIVTSCTDGFGADVEFRPGVQGVIDEIIRACEYHPLALANVAVSINGKGIRAKYRSAWREVQESLHDYLNCCNDRPLIFGTWYPDSVGASLMLMIDTLRADNDALNLLYLLAFCDGPWVPEPVVRFLFTSMIQPKVYKYTSSRDLLEGRSLVKSRLHTVHVRGDEEESEFWLSMHSLRRYYILEKKHTEMRSLSIKLMSGSRSSREDTEVPNHYAPALTSVIASMYGKETLKFLAKGGNCMQSDNNSRTSKGLDVLPDFQFMPSSSRILPLKLHTSDAFKSLVWLLDGFGQLGWKQHAYVSAQNVMLDFAMKGEIDDVNMAHLVGLPEATEAVFLTLVKILISEFGRDHKFCPSHPETTRSLVMLSSDGRSALSRRRYAVDILELIARFEDVNLTADITHLYRSLQKELKGSLDNMTPNDCSMADMLKLHRSVQLLVTKLTRWKKTLSIQALSTLERIQAASKRVENYHSNNSQTEVSRFRGSPPATQMVRAGRIALHDQAEVSSCRSTPGGPMGRMDRMALNGRAEVISFRSAPGTPMVRLNQIELHSQA